MAWTWLLIVETEADSWLGRAAWPWLLTSMISIGRRRLAGGEGCSVNRGVADAGPDRQVQVIRFVNYAAHFGGGLVPSRTTTPRPR